MVREKFDAGQKHADYPVVIFDTLIPYFTVLVLVDQSWQRLYFLPRLESSVTFFWWVAGI